MAVTRPLPFSLSLWHKVVVVAIGLWLLQSVGLTHFMEAGLSRVAQPLQNWWVRRISAGLTSYQGFTKVFHSAAHIQNLELRLAEANSALTELETLKKENTELRFLLENTDRPHKKTLLTRPVVALARPAISGGRDVQLQKGALVLSREVLLGQLQEIGEYESQVVLLSEKEAPPLLAETDTGVRGIVRGDGRKILFTEVARTDLLQVGQRVVTVGQPQVEQGVFIGRILKIETDPVASVQTALLEQHVSFFESPVVEVR